MNAREVVRHLTGDGWIETKGRGSHRNFRHPLRPGKVTMPFHGGKDLSIRRHPLDRATERSGVGAKAIEE